MAWAVLLLATACAASGCAVHDIDTAYGRRRGSTGGDSVNGTAVLAGMFEAAGHKVATRRYLSPRIHDYDVIVWFPDDFEPPDEEAQEFLEQWLQDGRNRTLIYVGRDYDAAVSYWESILPQAPPEQAVEVMRRLAKAKSQHDRDRAAMPASEDGRWFHVSGNHPPRSLGKRQAAPTLRGRWCDDGTIDPTRVDLHIRGRLEEPARPTESRTGGKFRSQVLLASQQDVLVRRITNTHWLDSRILIVTNGSFLLNLPLVEHEHRKLAGKLIAECGPATNKVAFLESGPGGPQVFEEEPGENYPTGFEAFTVWPIGAILLHFVVLGIVFLGTRVMIFGRPYELPRKPVSDFGNHIEALSNLLAPAQDHRYAERRLADYHDKVKRDAGASSSHATASGGTS
jgi:hypothetical protein